MMAEIATLLAHFYVSPLSENQMAAVARHWRDALAEFPEWAISEAVSEWVMTQKKKPAPAAIRKLCQQHFAVVEFTRQKAMRGATGQPAPSQKPDPERAKRMADIGNSAIRRMGQKMEAGQ